eukprot:gene17115-biopygen12851
MRRRRRRKSEKHGAAGATKVRQTPATAGCCAEFSARGLKLMYSRVPRVGCPRAATAWTKLPRLFFTIPILSLPPPFFGLTSGDQDNAFPSMRTITPMFSGKEALFGCRVHDSCFRRAACDALRRVHTALELDRKTCHRLSIRGHYEFGMCRLAATPGHAQGHEAAMQSFAGTAAPQAPRERKRRGTPSHRLCALSILLTIEDFGEILKKFRRDSENSEKVGDIRRIRRNSEDFSEFGRPGGGGA